MGDTRRPGDSRDGVAHRAGLVPSRRVGLTLLASTGNRGKADLFCLCSDDRDGEDSEFCQPKYIRSGELVLQRLVFSFWLYRARRVRRPTPCSLTKLSSTLLGIPTSGRSC